MGRGIKILCRIKTEDAGVTRKIRTRESKIVEIIAEERIKTSYTYDVVFGEDAGQDVIYEDGILDLVHKVLNGCNVSVIAYGQTGSGKTYTLFGDMESNERKGLIPRTVEYITKVKGISLKLSMIEIYLEKVRDLLDESQQSQYLAIRGDKDGHFYVKGAREVELKTIDLGIKILKDSFERRIYAKTHMNDNSSRGHLICSLIVSINDRKKAIMRLFDLAGSEKPSEVSVMSSSTPSIIGRESQFINKSLSALGNVMNALSLSRSHVPYRDSKVTLLLRETFRSPENACLILNCSSEPSRIHETIETLRFGARAGNIKPSYTPLNSKNITLAEENNILKEKVAHLEFMIQNPLSPTISRYPASTSVSSPVTNRLSDNQSLTTTGSRFSLRETILSTPPATPKFSKISSSLTFSPTRQGSIPPSIRKFFESDPEFLYQLEQEHK